MGENVDAEQRHMIVRDLQIRGGGLDHLFRFSHQHVCGIEHQGEGVGIHAMVQLSREPLRIAVAVARSQTRCGLFNKVH